jgi:hypothetical protein
MKMTEQNPGDELSAHFPDAHRTIINVKRAMTIPQLTQKLKTITAMMIELRRKLEQRKLEQ